MSATIITAVVLGIVITAMVLGTADGRPRMIGDPAPAWRPRLPRRWVQQLVAGGLEHTVVVAPRWHPFTEPIRTSDAETLRGVRIAAALLLRTLLWRREWTVAVLRQQTKPFKYHEHLLKETHPNREAAFARAAEVVRSLTAGKAP